MPDDPTANATRTDLDYLPASVLADLAASLDIHQHWIDHPYWTVERAGRLLVEHAWLRREVADLQRQVEGHCARIAAQSELLTARAHRVPADVLAAAERVAVMYEHTQALLPLAGGVPRPIDKSTDHCVVMARYLTSLRAREAE